MRRPTIALLVPATASLVLALAPLLGASASADDSAPPPQASGDVTPDVQPDVTPEPTDATVTPTPTPTADDDSTDQVTTDVTSPPPTTSPTTDGPGDGDGPSDHPNTDPTTAPTVRTPDEGDDQGGGHDGGGHGGHGGHGVIPDGVTITVDGRDISSSDPATSLPKIAGCAFDVAVTGLPTDPEPTIGVKITAWPPTASEEDRPVLVDVTSPSADGSFTASYPLDEAVLQFTPKANGFHMRLELAIDGTPVAMKMYWLGCGQPQTGDPRRVIFDVEWLDSEGAAVAGPLDSVLPPAWRDSFGLSALSERGTANCRYEADSDDLICTYDNPGHESKPGLVLPGEPGTTYEVSATGIPSGWTLDPTSVGTFLADVTCPKGHHDDGDDHDVAGRAVEGDDQAPCVHTVTLMEDEVVTPPTDDPGPDNGGGGNAEPPTDNPPADDQQPTVEQDSGSSAARLPMTGSTIGPLLLVGLLLTAGGIALITGTRPRHKDATSTIK